MLADHERLLGSSSEYCHHGLGASPLQVTEQNHIIHDRFYPDARCASTFPLNSAIFGCGGNHRGKPQMFREHSWTFFRMGVRSYVSGLFHLSGIASGRSLLSGVSSRRRIHFHWLGTTAELSISGMGWGHNHCGSRGESVKSRGDIRFQTVSATGVNGDIALGEKCIVNTGIQLEQKKIRCPWFFFNHCIFLYG